MGKLFKPQPHKSPPSFLSPHIHTVQDLHLQSESFLQDVEFLLIEIYNSHPFLQIRVKISFIQFIHMMNSRTVESKEGEPAEVSVPRGPPHEALFLVLAYLHLFELLNMSEVCRSIRDAVDKDVLLWLHIVVEKPLNLLFSDEIMAKITSKANGRLRTLALMNCTKITDDGLQRVIEKNPHINRLYLPACTGLTPEGVIKAVETLTDGYQVLNCVKINGIYNMKKEHLEKLRSCLRTDPAKMEGQMRQPCFFHDHRNFSVLRVEDSNRPIDVEVCPRCLEARMVFDCPRESCKKKKAKEMTECRACYFCIPRCEECGKCIEDEEPEVLCADILCSDCWLQLPKCDFCNLPYCHRHANLWQRNPGSTGSICGICHVNFIGDLMI